MSSAHTQRVHRECTERAENPGNGYFYFETLRFIIGIFTMRFLNEFLSVRSEILWLLINSYETSENVERAQRGPSLCGQLENPLQCFTCVWIYVFCSSFRGFAHCLFFSAPEGHSCA